MSASLIGRLGSSTFRLSTTAVLMSLTGSRFSSESAPGPSRALPLWDSKTRWSGFRFKLLFLPPKRRGTMRSMVEGASGLGASLPTPRQPARPRPSIVEDRDFLRRPRARQRLHERVDVGDVLVRQHRVGIGGHVVSRIAELTLEAVEGERRVGEDWRRTIIGTALAGAAVTGEAAVSKVDALAVGGVALRGVLCLRDGECTRAE